MDINTLFYFIFMDEQEKKELDYKQTNDDFEEDFEAGEQHHTLNIKTAAALS